MGIKKLNLKSTNETVGKTSRTKVDGSYKKFVIGKDNAEAKGSVFYNLSLKDADRGAVRSISRDESQDIWSSALEFAGADGVLNEDEMRTMFQDWGYLPKEGEKYEDWAARQAGDDDLKVSDEVLQAKWKELQTTDGAQSWFEKGQNEFNSYVEKQFGVDVSQEGVEKDAKTVLQDLASANPDNPALQDLLAKATAEGADVDAICKEAMDQIANGSLAVQTVDVTTKIDSWEDVNQLLKDNYPGYANLSKEEKSKAKEEFMNANPQYFKPVSELKDGQSPSAYDSRIINGYSSLPVGTKLNMPGGSVAQSVVKALGEMAAAPETASPTGLTAQEAANESAIDAQAAGYKLAAAANSLDDILNAEGESAEAKSEALKSYYASEKFDPAEIQNYPGGTKAYLDNLAAKAPEGTIGFIVGDLVGKIADQDTKLEIMQYVNDDYAKEGEPSKLAQALEVTFQTSPINGQYTTYENDVIEKLNFHNADDVNTVMAFIQNTGASGLLVDDFNTKVQQNALSMTPAQIDQFNSMAASNADLEEIDVISLGRTEFKTAEPPYYTQLDADGREGKYDYATGKKLSATNPDTGEVETFEYITDANTGETTVRGSFVKEGSETPYLVNNYNEYLEKTGYETHSTANGASVDEYYSVKDGENIKDKDVTTKDGITVTNTYDHENNTTVRIAEDKSQLDKNGAGRVPRTESVFNNVPPAADEKPAKFEDALLLYVKGSTEPIEESVVRSENGVVVYRKDTLVDKKTGTVKQTSERSYNKDGVLTAGEFTRDGVTYQIEYKPNEDPATKADSPYVGTMTTINPETGAKEYAGAEYLDSNFATKTREFYQEVKDENGKIIGSTKVVEDADGKPVSGETEFASADNIIKYDEATGKAVILNADGQVVADAVNKGNNEVITYRTGTDGKRYQESVTYADKDHTKISKKVTSLVDENGKVIGTASEEAYDKNGNIITLTEYQEGKGKKDAIKAVTTYTYNDQGIKTSESKTVDGKEVSKVEYEVRNDGTVAVKQSQEFITNEDGSRIVITRDSAGIPTKIEQETKDANGNTGTQPLLDPLKEAEVIYGLTQGKGGLGAIDADGLKNYLAQTGVNLAYISEAFEKTYGKTISEAIEDSRAEFIFEWGGATDADKQIGADIAKMVEDAKAGAGISFSDVEGYGYVATDLYNSETGMNTASILKDATGHIISPEAQQAAVYMDRVMDPTLSEADRKAAADKLQTFAKEHTGTNTEFAQFMKDCGNAYRYQILDEVPEEQTKDELNTDYRYFFTAMNAASQLVGEDGDVKASLTKIIKGEGSDTDKVSAEVAAEICSAALDSEGLYSERVYTELQWSSNERTRDIISEYSEKYGEGSFLKDVAKLDNWNDISGDIMEAYNENSQTREALMKELVASGNSPIAEALIKDWKNACGLFQQSKVSDVQQAHKDGFGDSAFVTTLATYYTLCSKMPVEGEKPNAYISKSDLEFFLKQCDGLDLTDKEALASMVSDLQELYDDSNNW